MNFNFTRRLLAALVCCAISFAASIEAVAATYSISEVMNGLVSPRGLALGPDGALYVAEAGNGGTGPSIVAGTGNTVFYGTTGGVSRLFNGVQSRVLSGVGSLATATGQDATGLHDILFDGAGQAFGLIGLGANPSLRADLGSAGAAFGTIVRLPLSGQGSIEHVADLAAHELANNPAGGSIDSNPFGFAHTTLGDFLVADAGGNDFLKVTATGLVSTLGVVPARPNPLFPMGPPMFQAVPTAIAIGSDNAYYIGQLTGFPFPQGEANVYRFDPTSNSLTVAYTGFTNIVDLTFDDAGNMFVLQITTNGLASATGPGTGALFKIDAVSGERSLIASDGLFFPSSVLAAADGTLYVSNRGTSPNAGQVLKLTPVPEPTGFALFLVGLALFAMRSLRKSRHFSTRMRGAVCFLMPIAISATGFPGRTAQADIFQWEYINPANPVEGKQASALLTPGGSGVSAELGVNLANRNLTKAYLINADLSPWVGFDEWGYYGPYTRANLTNTKLTNADLSGAMFNAATMTGANLTNAEIRGANFDRYDQYGYSSTYGYGTGITMAQLTSTASYAAHDLSGISLGLHNLTGANFTGFNLTNARFAGANLTNTNFRNANLTGATISGTLTGTNFTGAEIRGANLWEITKSQLYSTASYQSGDLTGINLYSAQTNWNFAGKNLMQAQFQGSMNFSGSNFSGANLSGVYLSYINFQNANLSHANLTNANFAWGKLAGTNLTGAVVRGADFSRDAVYANSGLSPAQLMSTASYVDNDLGEVKLRYNILTGVNLQGKTLTNVDLTGASLEGANFAGADVRGARLERDLSRSAGGITPEQLQSTASYVAHDLTGISLGGNNLAGINLAGQNLSQARFASDEGYGANLSGANFNGANLSFARFGYSNLSNTTLVQANLTGVSLTLAKLTNANFSQANLSMTSFSGYVIVVPGDIEGGGGYYNFAGADLTGVNLSGADLTRADFSGTYDQFGYPFPGATLTNANLSGADTRGASFMFATMTGADTSNLIQTDGHIAGLSLPAGKSLRIRDFDSFAGPDVPIVVDQHLMMSAAGTLRMEFDADAWGSTISFAPGISVTRGGTLELTFSPDVGLASQIGRTIDLFDWTGVMPTGLFAVSSPYTWNLSKLYTTGEVTLSNVPGLLVLGDFSRDGQRTPTDIQAMLKALTDLNAYQLANELSDAALVLLGDFNGDHAVSNRDIQGLLNALAGSGSVTPIPEPSTFALAALGLLGLVSGRISVDQRNLHDNTGLQIS